MAEAEKKCLIGIKHAITEHSGHSYGYAFDHLEECCIDFKRFFEDTGNAKVPNFNYFNRHADRHKPGCHLDSRGGEMVVALFFETGQYSAFSEKLNFCPFCGAPIEVKVVKRVMLVSKKKEVFDRYEERELSDK